MSLKMFYQDPFYQIKAFAANAAIMIALDILLYSLHSANFYRFHFAYWQLLLVPLGIYLGGISAVWIHNATHQSFPNNRLNRLCGEIAGIHQLWGFTGWRLIHLIHHQYSDMSDQDPHNPKDKSFVEFTAKMFIGSSFNISRRYREHWGQTPRTKLLQFITIAALVTLAASSLAFWVLLLGPAGFLWFYIPSYITNHLLFAHINYYCHPLNAQGTQTEAANLSHNLYYKLANIFWHGIYFHENHHRKPMLFNPKRMYAHS